jgi:predicted permease
MQTIPMSRRSLVWVADARRDLQYAVRLLGRAPGFTVAAVLTLALGIGSITLIYSVIQNVLLDPLPYPNSDRLVNVFVRDTQTGRARQGMSAPELLDFKEQSSAFEDVIATAADAVGYMTSEQMEYLRAVSVSPNFFDFMGLDPLLGRTTTLEDGRPGAAPVAVLRHRAWVTYFHADRDIVGRTIVLNGEPRTIVGVMPPRFTWHAADLWIPRPLDRSAPDAGRPFRAFQARLKPGVSVREAEAQLDVIATRRAREHPKEYPASFQMQVVNVIEFTVGAFSGVLYTMLAAVALLLLIACCNVANMLLARAISREREMTVRAALGAGRGRIIRQLLVESLLLAMGGAAAGCLLAYAGIDVLVGLLPPNPLPGEVDIRLNRSALLFSLMAAGVSALLFGIAPALYGARRDLVEGLRSAGKGIAGGRGRLRNALVTAEIALSLVLLLGAGVLARTFISLVRADLGFDPDRILVVPVAFPPGEAAASERHQFYERALQRIASLPGIEAASATTNIPPFGGPSTTELHIPSQPRSNRTAVMVQLCTPDYFQTLGIRFERGQGLTALAMNDMPREAVVNRALAGTYFGAEDPLGQRITLESAGGDADPARFGTFEIVGVVEDTRNQGIRDRAAPHVYLASATTGRGAPMILVRSSADPLLSAKAIRREIALVDRDVAVLQTRTLAEFLDRSSYAQPRFSLIVLGAFAIAGTLLVAIGVFSVMAYVVSLQTREIAVRMALGATHRQVLGVVLRLGTELLAVGIAVGISASFATSRLLANQLWNTSPNDPLTTVAAACTIAVVALTACYIPARRAMAIDPMAALRQE